MCLNMQQLTTKQKAATVCHKIWSLSLKRGAQTYSVEPSQKK